MKVFDHKAEIHHKLNWSSRDRSFSCIERSMRQKRVAPGEATATTSSRSIPRSSDQGRINSCMANSWCDMLEIPDRPLRATTGLSSSVAGSPIGTQVLHGWYGPSIIYGPLPINCGKSVSSRRNILPT